MQRMRLHDYQKVAVEFLLRRMTIERKNGGLWLDMGLGKTAITLHVIQQMRWMEGVGRTLIVAPKRVVTTDTWGREAAEWGIDLKVVALDERQRRKKRLDPADIYTISCDSLKWLEKQNLNFDMLVVDESTKFKNWTARRTTSIRRLAKMIPWRVTLTGTPVPNSLGDIFSQQFILDMGETLGSTIGRFRDAYMRPCGFEMRDWEMIPQLIETLQNNIAPWYLSQSALDHLDMPDLIRNEIKVEMPESAVKVYRGVLKELISELESGATLATMSSSGRYNLLRQITSGCAYDDDGQPQAVHDAKLDAISDLLESLRGKPLIVAYCYRHEMTRLRERFPNIRAINGDTSDAESQRVIDDWIAGKVRLLAVQCQAMSHGVNGLQKAGNDICWMTLTDQPEIKLQLEARLWRQGVQGQVRIHYLLVDKSIDQVVYRTQERKESTQKDVLNAIRDYALATSTGDC